jgi:hypothetical protein
MVHEVASSGVNPPWGVSSIRVLKIVLSTASAVAWVVFAGSYPVDASP